MAGDNSYYADTDWQMMDFETPAEKRAKLEKADAVEAEKGVCPKCKRHIGRGLHIHMKACNGPVEQA